MLRFTAKYPALVALALAQSRYQMAVSRPKLHVSSQVPSEPLAPAATQSNAVSTSALGKAQQLQANADAGAVRDHCKFQRGLLAVAYRQQLEGKYGALPVFKTWFERFITALWEGLNENVKRDIPRKRDFLKIKSFVLTVLLRKLHARSIALSV